MVSQARVQIGFIPVKIDLLLDPFGASWNSLVEIAEAAESLGFDGLWTFAGSVPGATTE